MKIETYKQAIEAVSKNGWIFEYVPKHLKTAELCIIAMQNNPLAHQFIPDNLKLELNI